MYAPYHVSVVLFIEYFTNPADVAQLYRLCATVPCYCRTPWTLLNNVVASYFIRFTVVQYAVPYVTVRQLCASQSCRLPIRLGPFTSDQRSAGSFGVVPSRFSRHLRVSAVTFMVFPTPSYRTTFSRLGRMIAPSAFFLWTTPAFTPSFQCPLLHTLPSHLPLLSHPKCCPFQNVPSQPNTF